MQTRESKNVEAIIKEKIVKEHGSKRIEHRIITIDVIMHPTAIGETREISEIKTSPVNVIEMNALERINASVRIVATNETATIAAKAQTSVAVATTRNSVGHLIGEIVVIAQIKVTDKIARIVVTAQNTKMSEQIGVREPGTMKRTLIKLVSQISREMSK
jgi:hypothetical protein